jgi:hypothetical protein
MKSIFSSRVFWLAVAQAVAGSLVVFSSAYPDVGALIIAKSVVDIALRFVTTKPVAF